MNYEDIFAGRDPLQLTLVECMLTYVCNIRCSYCFNPHHRHGAELSPAEWSGVLRQAREMGALATIFNGGEPLAYSHCVDVIKDAHAYGFITGISTNGMLLHPAVIRELAPSLDVLQISLHPWRYIDDLVGGIQPLAQHVRMFKELGGKRTVFKIVLYRGLAAKLEQILNVVHELACNDLDSVGVQAALPLGFGYLDQSTMPTFEECRQANLIVEQYSVMFELKLDNGLYDHFTVRPNLWGRYGVIVNPQGEVYPLIEAVELLSFMFNQLEFDNVRKASLREIWERSPVMNKFRGTDWHREPCVSCRLRSECGGGSRLNAYIMAKDMYEADPFCELSPQHESLMAVYQR